MNIQIEAEPSGDMEQHQCFICLPHSPAAAAITYSQRSKSSSVSTNSFYHPSVFVSLRCSYTAHDEAMLQHFLLFLCLCFLFIYQGQGIMSQQRWVNVCVVLYRSAVINRACQMKSVMPARLSCTAGHQCLRDKQRWTHMIGFLTFPDLRSRQTANDSNHPMGENGLNWPAGLYWCIVSGVRRK